ncbi:MAG TPA: serine/threonine-protein kinase [Polyangiaceae bacterium]|jgi:serine/threonine-protein kinase|nr:serine/threonine-protein kinase [Polyangiaceae bacterium]
MASAALQEGDVFAGRYRIVRELASGGMGAVYEVVHNVTERRCALKVMLSHTVEREQLRKRFMQESRLAAQIGSEYIVDVLDAGVDEDTKAPYLVMELLEGEDLGQRLLRQGALGRDETVGYLWHVALALDRTHQAGIVHRDLKASNLFVTRREDGTALVKVLDFGVAKVLTMERSGEHRTQTVGTPIYMAPEQFRAEGRISPATDIYALGMLAYTLLVGVHYWTREHERCENPFAFASIAVHGPQDNPSARALGENVTLPPAFDDWFFRATSRWPQDRFASATAAVSELALALGVEVPVAPSLPIANAATLEPSSGGGHLLQATIESPSARLTGTGLGLQLPTAAGSDMPPPNARDREQHTEVSLSVTSGGLPLDPGEQLPSRRRGSAIAMAFAVAAVVAAAFVALSIYSSANHETVKSNAAVRPPPSATAAPVPAKPAEPPRGVTRIEELPIAPPERHVDVAPVGTDDAHRVGTGHTRPHPSTGTEHRPDGTHPSGEPTTGTTATEPTASPSGKKSDHDSLWGRD